MKFNDLILRALDFKNGFLNGLLSKEEGRQWYAKLLQGKADLSSILGFLGTLASKATSSLLTDLQCKELVDFVNNIRTQIAFIPGINSKTNIVMTKLVFEIKPIKSPYHALIVGLVQAIKLALEVLSSRERIEKLTSCIKYCEIFINKWKPYAKLALTAIHNLEDNATDLSLTGYKFSL